jgi:hypothetical protein
MKNLILLLSKNLNKEFYLLYNLQLKKIKNLHFAKAPFPGFSAIALMLPKTDTTSP